MASKEALVVIIDIGSSMNDVRYNPSRLDSAREALGSIVWKKVRPPSTNNRLHEDLGGYEHISVAKDLGPPSAPVLTSVTKVDGSSAQGDLLDALVVALGQLVEISGKMRRRILVATDGGSPIHDLDQLSTIRDKLDEIDCKLDVLGVDFGDDSRRSRDKTETKRRNEQTIRDLVASVGGHLIPIQKADEVLKHFSSQPESTATKFRGILDLGGAGGIPIRCYLRVKESTLPRLMKMTQSEQPIRQVRHCRNEDGEEVDMDNVEDTYSYGKNRFPVSRFDTDSMKIQGLKELVLLGFTDRRNIPRQFFLSTVDMLVADPGNDSAATALSALAHALDRTNRCGIARFVPRKDAQPKLVALTPCIKRGERGDSVAAETESAVPFDALFVNTLPFDEDIRDFQFHPFDADPRFEPSEEQRRAASEVVDALDLRREEAQPSDPSPWHAIVPEQGFAPFRVPNPAVHRFYQVLRARVEEPGAGLLPMETSLQEAISPPPGLHGRAAEALYSFAQQFPLRQSEGAAKRGKKRYWGETEREKGQEREEEDEKQAAAAAVKKPRGGDEGDTRAAAARGLVEGFGQGAPRSVGSVDPIRDWRAIVDHSGKDESAVVRAWQEFNEQIGRMTNQAAQHQKSVDLLREMRGVSLQYREPRNYNKLLYWLRDRCDPSRARGDHSAITREFWEQLKAANILPIHEGESNAVGDLTAEQAGQFYQVQLPAAAAPPPVPVASASAADDEFDDMD